jgi:16S rRNA (cytosine967-C5)-methyltransferase
MIAPARIAAYEALTAVSAGNADLPTAIAFARASLRDERDRALAADIAAGVQRWRATLDHLVFVFAHRSLDRLDPEIIEILRLSAYQLLHHTRVPASAVVDDAVNLTRRVGKASAAGFVNAVLRTISRKRERLPLPPRPTEGPPAGAALDYLSVTLSHPRWLAARWLTRYGFEAAEAWMTFNNQPAPLTLRLNRLKMDRAGLEARLAAAQVTFHAARYAPDALIVDAGYPLRGDGLTAGAFVVQDEASQLVALLAGASPGPRTLDACAAPGGKTTFIAAAMRNEGLLVACDVRPRRIELLRQTVSASGAANVRIVQADLLHPLPFSRPFDTVFVDAPCSGLGTVRRDPDIKWHRREADLTRLAEAERVMLQHAASAVAPGGLLVYATCSSEPEENEEVAAAFISAHDDFGSVDVRGIAPAVPHDVIDARGHLRTLPHVHGLEAFFGAAFRKKR